MKEAGLTHGGFYRHFGSRDQLVAEAAQLALRQGSEPTMAAGRLGGAGGTSRWSTATLVSGTGTIPSPAVAWPASR